MRVLITGGAGFIGSHIQDRCIADGHQVAVLDNQPQSGAEWLQKSSQYFQVDVCDKQAIEKAFATCNPEIVFHLAGQIDVQFSIMHPELDAAVNILGMIHVAQAAIHSGVTTFVYSNSGGAMYGNVPATHLPVHEDDSTARPISPYGISKLTAETYLQRLATSSPMKWISLRYSNVYGPRQGSSKESGVVSRFVQHLQNNTQPTLYGDGSSTRDYVYIDDVVEANMKSLQAKTSGACNISTGVETSVLDLYSILQSLMHTQITPKHESARDEIVRSCLSPGLAKKMIGWTPATSLHEGLERTIAWQRDQK